jgi:hypothetical protein
VPTTNGPELEPPNNGNVGWSANEPYTSAFVRKPRSAVRPRGTFFCLEVAGGS